MYSRMLIVDPLKVAQIQSIVDEAETPSEVCQEIYRVHGCQAKARLTAPACMMHVSVKFPELPLPMLFESRLNGREFIERRNSRDRRRKSRGGDRRSLRES
jgi:hypothetical protein